MKRTKWTERKFSFDMPEGWLANVLERLQGTPARMVEMCKSLRNAELEYKLSGKWSIKEHIGHLVDLEDLHEGRIDDFVTRKETLRAADMSNKKTEEAHHNTTALVELISQFSEKRTQFIHRLKQLDEETQCFKPLHPRLKTPMRPIDVAYFTAEHDDHHLASVREIIESIAIKIVPAKSLSQLETIEWLASEIIPEFYADVIPHDHNIFFVKKFQTAEAIQEQLNNGYEYYLLNKNDTAFGYFGLQIDKSKSEMVLSKLYLLKEYRGLGYGTRAMDFIIERVDKLNIAKVTLTVNRKKERTIGFYEKYGFVISNELTNKFENGHTILDYEMTRISRQITQ